MTRAFAIACHISNPSVCASEEPKHPKRTTPIGLGAKYIRRKRKIKPALEQMGFNKKEQTKRDVNKQQLVPK
jgi:hypothetical protein